MNELNDNIADVDDDEFIDPDLLCYSTSTRGGEQLIYLTINNWNVSTLESYRTNNDSEAENHRLNTRIS